MLVVAQGEEHQKQIEDELFALARALEDNDELRSILTDQQVPPGRRQQVVEELLDGRAQGEGKAVAEVRSAIELSDEQQSRLADALATATGKDVEVKVIVDPSVLGGLIAQVGDTVIDGSVRHRLDQLRESFATRN
jgi:F-type H+-transporting ATPase subunit delta